MEQITFQLILCLISTVSLTQAFSQDFSSRLPDSATIETKKSAAIHAANDYIAARLSNKQHKQWFLVDTNTSLIICSDYKTFFNSTSASCFPVGFEIGFHILLKNEGIWDTLHTNLFLRLDSSFSASEDTLSNMWNDELLRAWEKVIAVEYKFSYTDVLQFIRQKRLPQYSIDFGYERTGYKVGDKIYWFVTFTECKRSLLYRINPETGAFKVKKHLPVKLRQEFPTPLTQAFSNTGE